MESPRKDDLVELNFWPAFADLMLSIVLVLMLILSLIMAILAVGGVDMEPVQRKQKKMVDELATIYSVLPEKIDESTYRLKRTGIDLTIRNEFDRQLLTFSESVLYKQDETELSPEGVKLLSAVGRIISQQLTGVKEIQIQGHADPVTSRKHGSNLELAAKRAMGVFQFFYKNVGIDPTECLMSATSFGEYKPTERTADTPFDAEKLREANRDPQSMKRNRRVEVLLFYRNDAKN